MVLIAMSLLGVTLSEAEEQPSDIGGGDTLVSTPDEPAPSLTLYFIPHDDYPVGEYTYYGYNGNDLASHTTNETMDHKEVYQFSGEIKSSFRVSIHNNNGAVLDMIWEEEKLNSELVYDFNTKQYLPKKFDEKNSKPQDNNNPAKKSTQKLKCKGKTYNNTFDDKSFTLSKIKSNAGNAGYTYKITKSTNKNVIKKGTYKKKVKIKGCGATKINVKVISTAKGYKNTTKEFKNIKITVKPGKVISKGKKQTVDSNGKNHHKQIFGLKNKCKIDGYKIDIYSNGKWLTGDKITKNSYQIAFSKFKSVTVKICAYVKVGNKELCGEPLKYTIRKK